MGSSSLSIISAQREIKKMMTAQLLLFQGTWIKDKNYISGSL